MKCCDLTAGKLRHRIDIQRESRTADGAGGASLAWLTIALNIPAMIKPLSGNETMAAQRLEANISHRIYIRYAAGFRSSDRIVFDGRMFQIRAILNLEERNRWLEIQAEEGVAQ